MINSAINLLELLISKLKAVRRLTKWQKRSGHSFVSIPDKEGVSQRKQEIPTTVYQTTKTKMLDSEQVSEMNRFRELNPGLTFRVFDEEETDEYMLAHWGSHPVYSIYQRSLFGQMKADIFRLCILHDRGGYYVDINKAIFADMMSMHRPTDKAFLSLDFVDYQAFPKVELAKNLINPHKLVAQWAFGFVKRHPILTMAIEEIVAREPFFRGVEFRSVRDAIFSFTAPAMFTDVVRNYLLSEGFDDITFAGIYFNGAGVPRVKGSHRMLNKPKHYTQEKRKLILSSE